MKYESQSPVLGMSLSTNCAVFFNIVQKGVGLTHVKKNTNFLITLWHKIGIEIT